MPAPTAADSARDSQQVLDTYRDMYAATFHGNRAPLVLGNHFNEWNNNAYSDALATFVLETCGQPGDPVRHLQRPRRLDAGADGRTCCARLQAQAPELG